MPMMSVPTSDVPAITFAASVLDFLWLQVMLLIVVCCTQHLDVLNIQRSMGKFGHRKNCYGLKWLSCIAFVVGTSKPTSKRKFSRNVCQRVSFLDPSNCSDKSPSQNGLANRSWRRGQEWFKMRVGIQGKYQQIQNKVLRKQEPNFLTRQFIIYRNTLQKYKKHF